MAHWRVLSLTAFTSGLSEVHSTAWEALARHVLLHFPWASGMQTCTKQMQPFFLAGPAQLVGVPEGHLDCLGADGLWQRTSFESQLCWSGLP